MAPLSLSDLDLDLAPDSDQFSHSHHSPFSFSLPNQSHHKSIPFSLPDPYEDESIFELYDPRGMSLKTRRESRGADRDRDREESRDRVPSLSPPTKAVDMDVDQDMEGQGETRHANRGGEVGGSGTSGSAGQNVPLSNKPTHPLTPPAPLPIDIDPFPTSSPHILDSFSLPSAFIPRNPLQRLRIGSAGTSIPPPPLAQEQDDSGFSLYETRLRSSPTSSPSHSHSRERERERSDTTSSSGPFSPAASFLSSFSPPSHPPPDLSFVQKGDEEGYRIASLADSYVLGKELGRGGFGIVREARRENGEIVAVKIVRHGGEEEEESEGRKGAVKRSQRSVSGVGRSTSLVERNRSSSNPVQLRNTRHFPSLTSSLSSLPPPAPLPTTSTPTLRQTLLEREIALWTQLAPHDHILSLISYTHNEEFSYIFMPLCEGGNLLGYLNESRSREKGKGRKSIPLVGSTAGKGLPLETVKEVFKQIVEGLWYLHKEAGVTHKDLKLENILAQVVKGKRVWKIADFGLAETISFAPTSDTSQHKKYLSDPPSSHSGRISPSTPLASLSRANSLTRPLPNAHLHPAGSLPYSSPEQMKSPIPLLSPSVDIWALGCVLYALVEGRLPFEDEFEPRLRMSVLRGEWEVPERIREEDSIVRVLRGCLEVDEERRWDVERVRECGWLKDSTTTTPNLDRDEFRGRTSKRPAYVPRTSSSSVRTSSTSASRRKERSTSRGTMALYGRKEERGWTRSASGSRGSRERAEMC